jgi:hypothetical protein
MHTFVLRAEAPHARHGGGDFFCFRPPTRAAQGTRSQIASGPRDLVSPLEPSTGGAGDGRLKQRRSYNSLQCPKFGGLGARIRAIIPYLTYGENGSTAGSDRAALKELAPTCADRGHWGTMMSRFLWG